MKRVIPEKLIDKYLNNTYKDPNTGCFIWLGSVTTNGYGQITLNKKTRSLHRAIYELHNNIVLNKKNVIMHICDTRSCININHLKLGTQSLNMLDASKKGRMFNPHRNKKYCINGHEFNELNTKFVTSKHRKCKICVKKNNDKSNANKKTFKCGHLRTDKNIYISFNKKRCLTCKI